MKSFTLGLSVCLIVCVLTACGQTGRLYLPTADEPTVSKER
jgi:predicted small lipoprotein YifL